jgi:hypothetical protein
MILNIFNKKSSYIYIDMSIYINQIVINDNYEECSFVMSFLLYGEEYSYSEDYIKSGGYFDCFLYDKNYNIIENDYLINRILENKEVKDYYDNFRELSTTYDIRYSDIINNNYSSLL